MVQTDVVVDSYPEILLDNENTIVLSVSAEAEAMEPFPPLYLPAVYPPLYLSMDRTERQRNQYTGY